MNSGFCSLGSNDASIASRTFRINSSRASPSVMMSRFPSAQWAEATKPPSISSSVTTKVISFLAMDYQLMLMITRGGGQANLLRRGIGGGVDPVGFLGGQGGTRDHFQIALADGFG